MKLLKTTVLSLLFTSFVINQSMSQNIAVANAVIYREQGDLIKAKEFIDKAVVHEKTIGSAKAWYYKGLIYFDLASNKKPEGANGFREAALAWKQVEKLDKPKGEWITEVEKSKHNLWANLINDGYNKGKDGQEQDAYQSLELAHELKTPEDTAYDYAFDYAKDIALKAKNYDQLKKYYLIELENSKKPTTYSNLSYIYQNENNPEKALEIVQKGRAKFPSDSKLMNDEINLFVVLKRVDEAKDKMETALKSDPKNVTLYYNLGTIYDKKGDDVKALENYNKAIELEPENYDANFNIAAYYFNKGVKLNNVVNNMSIKDYNTQGKKKEAERDVLLNKALSYFNICKKINPADPNLKAPLSDIDRILKRK
jgi:tetratricopeptide (TPR) repeat protein